jgi:hypothetical protein
VPPPDVVARARERAAARAARDWARADTLRAEIEAAGWRVVDHGTDFVLAPAAPATIEEPGRTRYGRAADVPSRLDEQADARFTVQLLAEDRPLDLAQALAALRAAAPAGTQVVVVANDPSPDQAARLEPGGPDLEPIGGRPPEVAWTSARLGHAAARNVGLRRATGELVVLAATSVEPREDSLGPLAAALADPAVAVAGGIGLVTADLRHYAESPGPDVDVIGGEWLAFRREDYRRLGPLDERFVSPAHLDAWWSLVLRAGDDPGAPPRHARRVELPLVLHAEVPTAAGTDPVAARLARRNAYRVMDAFRERAGELLLAGRVARG